MNILVDLQRKAKALRVDGAWQITHALFAKSGFTPDLMALAQTEGILLVGPAELVGEQLRILRVLDANGRPQGIILSGPYRCDPQLIAVGYALEQALNGRVGPNLDAAIAQIDAVTGQ